MESGLFGKSMFAISASLLPVLLRLSYSWSQSYGNGLLITCISLDMQERKSDMNLLQSNKQTNYCMLVILFTFYLFIL